MILVNPFRYKWVKLKRPWWWVFTFWKRCWDNYGKFVVISENDPEYENAPYELGYIFHRIEARQLIYELRGGIPYTCDFCWQNRPQSELHPEEAGVWICSDCIAKDPSLYYGK